MASISDATWTTMFPEGIASTFQLWEGREAENSCFSISATLNSPEFIKGKFATCLTSIWIQLQREQVCSWSTTFYLKLPLARVLLWAVLASWELEGHGTLLWGNQGPFRRDWMTDICPSCEVQRNVFSWSHDGCLAVEFVLWRCSLIQAAVRSAWF